MRPCRKNVVFSMVFARVLTLPYHSAGPYRVDVTDFSYIRFVFLPILKNGGNLLKGVHDWD